MLQAINSSDNSRSFQAQGTKKTSEVVFQNNLEVNENDEQTKNVVINGIEYNSEDVERWDSYIKDLHPTFLAFGIVATEGFGTAAVPAGTTSIHFYEFCSMLERGEVISAENTRSNNINYENAYWEDRLRLATYENEQSDIIKSQKILDIINQCYELGMMTKNNSLILPDELSKIHLVKKYEEQQSILTKTVIQNLDEQKQNLNQLYNSKRIISAYQNSI
ncbi:hypothetical protein SAMN05880501_11877 [Ureibacillus xyleni]|uniref:Uncharacterized protein n=2 Tax=Ureibacillus xyleni TaxID=614648 RepID=A0A285TQC6_9BACL|nr:hypothetical protein SAMN05880501_11877 [Ureibacillus xyleni]